MQKPKRKYNRVKRTIRLCAVWIVKILFGKCHFKVPIYKRIYYAIFGGFMPDQVALYNLTPKNRKEYLSEFDWYKSRYINEPYTNVLNNKIVFADLVKSYIRVPETICIKKDGNIYSSNQYNISNYDEVVKTLKQIKKAYIKPINKGKGIGVNRITYTDNQFLIDNETKSEQEIIEYLKDRKNWFLSECIEQSKTLNNIYDKTSNTIRLITVRDPKTTRCKVLYAVQRIGTKETIPVDNGSKGGLVSNINMETGELSEARSIQKSICLDRHPDSNNQIKGVKIENWPEIKERFVNIMEQLPYLYFIAWDILITEEGPVVIEANASSGVNIIQLWGGQRNKELGEFYRSHGIIK